MGKRLIEVQSPGLAALDCGPLAGPGAGRRTKARKKRNMSSFLRLHGTSRSASAYQPSPRHLHKQGNRLGSRMSATTADKPIHEKSPHGKEGDTATARSIVDVTIRKIKKTRLPLAPLPGDLDWAEAGGRGARWFRGVLCDGTKASSRANRARCPLLRTFLAMPRTRSGTYRSRRSRALPPPTIIKGLEGYSTKNCV